MMAGNPNWWSMNNNGVMHPHDNHHHHHHHHHHPPHHHHHHHQLSSSSSLPSPFAAFPPNSSNPCPISDNHHNPNPDFPVRSWSQLLMEGEDHERYGANLFQQQKKLESWEDQVLNLSPSLVRVPKQESAAAAQSGYGGDDEFLAVGSSSGCWPPMPPVSSSPTASSCITNSILNFSSAKSAAKPQDQSSECNSSSITGGVTKKARVQHSSAQPALKVRKEKLGDRITALHQLVSPFGKTDTASVLSEAIGYIRFLQGQIEALSSPYMRNAAAAAAITGHHQHTFLSDVGIERGPPKQDTSSEGQSDLRSRGLCLVPISCTQHMAGNDTAGGGADYWAPAALGGGF